MLIQRSFSTEMQPDLDSYPVLKLAQYFSGLTAHQNVYSEICSILLNVTNADLVAFGEKNSGGIVHLPYCFFNNNRDPEFNYSSETIDSIIFKKESINDEVKAAISETMESGFLTTKIIIEQVPLSMVFLPLNHENKISTVMIIGYVMSNHFDNKMLDILLAVAGLAGATAARLASESELKQHRRHLEKLVAERTNKLTSLNKTLQLEIEQRVGAEKALHLQRDNLINILEAMEDCIYIVSPEYKISYMNPAFQKTFNCSTAENITCYELLSKKAKICSWCNLKEVLAGNSIHREWHQTVNKRTYDIIETPLKGIDGTSSMMAIFRDITDRTRMEKKIHSQLVFEKLVAELSSHFVSLHPEQLDSGINYILELTGNFFQADRSYLFQFSADGNTMSNTHEWIREGIISYLEDDQNQPVEKTPWWAKLIRAREHVYIADVSKLPPEAAAEKEVFESQQIKSILCVPLVKEATLYGFFGFDSVREKKVWEDYQIAWLKVIAEIVVNALIRHENDNTIRHLSFHDQLTGLYNRHYFVNELQRLEGSRDYPITIISADLDGLKLINDTLGHGKGDHYLKNSASLLKENLRTSDILARVGGDEFALILPRTSQKTAEMLVERIRRSIEQHNENKTVLPVSISIGLAVNESKALPLEETYNLADSLMYKDKLKRSKEAQSNIVKAMLASLFEREDYYGGNNELEQELCVRLGQKAGLSEKQLADLLLLAQVHDIGMVAVPEGLLNRPESLSDLELENIRQHTERGYRIALASPELAEIADLLLHHHEHWNGSGYPLGLQGKAIPVECRILAVVDTYNAMISGRPNSKVLSHREALAEIKKLAGIRFDPEVVNALSLYCSPIGEE
jgi:diguanylate cyclase (GGDEF)-like protein